MSMVSELFDSLLKDVGKLFNIDLKPDENQSCLIKLKGGIEIQLELNKAQDHLILGCNLGQIPIGRYREQVFRAALHSNGLNPPWNGIFAYSKHTDNLVMFEAITLRELSSEKLAFIVPLFTTKAQKWKESIQAGDIPHVEGGVSSGSSGSKPGGVFGLRP